MMASFVATMQWGRFPLKALTSVDAVSLAADGTDHHRTLMCGITGKTQNEEGPELAFA